MEMRLLSAALENEIEAAIGRSAARPSSGNGWRYADFPPKSTTQKTCDAAGAWRKAEKSPS